jgi:N-acetylglucosaminyl-diphospho-decaprenol L-rhamnosyltransferase
MTALGGNDGVEMLDAVRSPVAYFAADRARLIVSIVTWRAADLTIDCLRSIAFDQDPYLATHVYIVDNDSGDGTAEAIESAVEAEGWGSWATLIRAPGNGGFSSGNNIAIREMLSSHDHADYVLLLNPDTWVRPGAFRILVDFLDQNPDAGIAGGRSEDPDATPQLCSFRFPSLISEVSLYLQMAWFGRLFSRYLTRDDVPIAPRKVDWVSGAHMMVRREVIREIGLMDEGYFLYYEETDFALQAQRAGWDCWHVPESRIVHLVGQLTGVSERNVGPRRIPDYWYESRRRFFIKNHGRLYAILTDLSVLSAYALNRLKCLILRRNGTATPHFVRDLLRNSALIKGIR